MDEQVQRGKQWLEILLKLMNIPADVQLGRVEENDKQGVSCWLTIDEANLDQGQINALVGKKGDTIDAVQYLANSLLNIGLGDTAPCFFYCGVEWLSHSSSSGISGDRPKCCC